ncbi:MAG TPA: peptide chain release factor-like protein [Pirellulaceae bacterium]|nr:peptide chain release factor-like protein [Pirellulaceae bacterium]
MHPAALPPDVLLADCDVERTRRGGPGGQHRNKVETAVVIKHQPTGVQGAASERRSQDLNRQAAVQRLRVNLALKVRQPVEPGQSSSEAWHSRVRARQIAVSSNHADFPALLAEALDRLTACDWEVATAAACLGVTTSQLTKFLQREPEAGALLNRQRAARQLRPLR